MTEKSRRGRRIVLLIVVGLAMAALAILYLTAPAPTIATVQVLNAETGAPLSGAQVQLGSRGAETLPPAITDATGVVRFEDVPPGPAYSLQVQKVDFAFGSEQNVAIPEEQETEIVVRLAPRPGERLFVGLDKATVAEIDAASWLTIQTIRLPGAPEALVYHLLLHPGEELLYAVAGDKGLILDSQSGAMLGRMQVEAGIESLDLSADGRYLLVSTVENGLDYSGTLGRVHLLALDAGSGEVVTDTILSEGHAWILPAAAPGNTGATRTGPAGTGSMPQIMWRPEGSHGYVLLAADRTVNTMAALSQRMLGVYGMPVGPLRIEGKVVLSHDKQYAYTWQQGYLPDADRRVDFLTMIWTDDGTVMSEDYPPGTSALAVSPVKSEVYILNSALDTFTILDLTGQGAQTSVAVGKSPDLMAVSRDGVWAYVANHDSQTISVVHLPSASVVHSIALPGAAYSLALR